jgi:Flp pilus assembly protein protease CpaA
MPPLTLRVVLHEPAINVVFAAFIVAMLANDLRHRRRPHPVTIWGGLLMFVSLPVRSALSQTAAWHHIAQWLIR